MKLLAIGTSPLQVQNAIQYIRQHKLDASECALAHVRSNREEDNQRARGCAEVVKWGVVESFPPFRGLPRQDFVEAGDWQAAEIENRAGYIRLIADFFARHDFSALDVVLLGDYRPMSFRQFLQFTQNPGIETVLLDDGSVSRYVMAFRSQGLYVEEVARGLSSYLGPDDPFKAMEPTSLTYFSIYEEQLNQVDSIVKNRQFDGEGFADFVIRDDEVWVCGVNHVEAGLARQDEFLSMCARVKSWFPGKRLVYFPHRREDDEKVELACKIMGAEISTYRYGIEEYTLTSKCKPHRAIVFGSTVADTLSRIFRDQDRVIVAVPSDKYFTGSARTLHVKNVVCDNIRKNDVVRGVPTTSAGLSTWFEAPKAKATPDTVAFTAVDKEADAPYTKLAGLSESKRSDSWYRLQETVGGSMHRAILASVPRSRYGTAFFHCFKVRTEERYAFKVRLANTAQRDEYIELSLELDAETSLSAVNEFGALAVEVSVSEERTSTVSVFFKTFKKVEVELQLIVRSHASTEGSLHPGSPTAGFSISNLAKSSQPVRVFDAQDESYTAQINVSQGGSAIVPVAADSTPSLVCFHGGLLDVLKADKLQMLHANVVIPLISCAVAGEAEAPLKKGKARVGKDYLLSKVLKSSAPVYIKKLSSRRLLIETPVVRFETPNRVTRFAMGELDVRTGTKVVLDLYQAKRPSSGHVRFLF